MLVLDENGKHRWRMADAAESQQERRQRLLAQDLKSAEVTVAPDGGRDITSPEARLGKPLSAQQIIGKLRKCNSRLYFEVSKAFPDIYGIYLTCPEGNTYVNPKGDVLTLRHICGMPNLAQIPEMTVVEKRTKRVPNPDFVAKVGSGERVDRDACEWKEIETYKSHIPGWRTILVRLLHAGLINRGDVEKHFGWIPSMPSDRWYTQTQ